jgi:transcriptional regulator with XRE-family HTH domain
MSSIPQHARVILKALPHDQPVTMTDTFGARLRAQREQRQVSLKAISAKLKIRATLLEQLENDRVTFWPKGIFGRAYLRDYAREIGMEPESVVREFFVRYPEVLDDASWPPGTTIAQPQQPHQPPQSTPSPAAPVAPSPAVEPQPLVMTAPQATMERRRGSDRRELNLSAAADVCSRLARALDARDLTTLLGDAARLLDAVGVVVWLWDPATTALRASVGHGYSSGALARLPAVRADEANAIASAYRSGKTCIVEGEEGATGAVVVPSVGPGGCVGVLALEVRHGGERNDSLRAFAALLAAQLGAQLSGRESAEPSPA